MRLVLTTLSVSFLGWLAETLYAFICYGKFIDRGFLTLPLCPIYGITLAVMHLLFGSPQDGRIDRLLQKTSMPRALRLFLDYLIYFAAATVIPTIFELAVGVFFHKVLGVMLWNYDMFAFNLGGYICLGFSLVWGVAITAAMATVWRGLTRLFSHLSERTVTVTVTVALSLIAADLVCNLAYIAVKKKHLVKRFIN